MMDKKIFVSESDYQAVIEGLRIVRQRYQFSLYAYVLMSNHFHLLLEVDRFPTHPAIASYRLRAALQQNSPPMKSKKIFSDVKIIETEFYGQVLQSHICCNAQQHIDRDSKVVLYEI